MQASYQDKSFAVQCMVKNKTTRSAILKVIGKIVQLEMAAICSDKHHSVLRLNTKDSVTNFEYVISNLMGEMSHRARFCTKCH